MRRRDVRRRVIIGGEGGGQTRIKRERMHRDGGRKGIEIKKDERDCV